MSSETGPRKRLKDKKRKKGCAGEANIPITTQRETPPTKLLVDETIHVQNEAKFGGNILSKLIFIAVLCVLGIILLFAVAEYNGYRDDVGENQLLWLPQFLRLDTYFANPNTDEPIDSEKEVEPQADQNYFDYFWQFVSFGESETFAEGTGEDANPKENYENKRGNFHAYDADLEKEATDDGDDINDTKDDDGNSDDEDDENEKGRLDDDEDGEKEDRLDDDDDDDDDEDDENEKDGPDDDDDEADREEERGDMNDDKDSDEDDQNDESDYDEDEDLLKKTDKEENDDEEIDRDRYTYSRGEATYEFDFEKLTNHYEEDEDENDNDDEGGADEMKQRDEYDSNREQADTEENEEPDQQQENETDDEENEPKSSSMITKLIVGIALVFVAYAVIIRKWNDYVNQLPENENLVPADLTETVQDQYDETFENLKNEMESKIRNQSDYTYDEGPYTDDNETLQEYLDSSTASESEDSKEENAMRWSTSGHDILAREVGDSQSETSDSDSHNFNVDQDPNVDTYASKDYQKANITNPYDWQYKDDLDDADDDFANGRVTVALEKYSKILRNHERSVRAKYGIARSLDVKAELQKSNELLARVINAYVDTLLAPDIPNALFEMVAERTVNRMRFKGDYASSIGIQNLLIDRFPEKVSYQNELVVTLLMLNRISEAKENLEKILLEWPDDGMATVHYGFVLKLAGNLTESVHYLDKGIKTNEKGTQDGRFYFHLGDALQRLKRDEEARQIYKKGVAKGLFYSEYQRSLYNVKRLTGRPWWTQEQTTYQPFFRTLEQNWKHIRDEGVFLLKQKQRTFTEESEQLRETGDWRQFELFNRGVKRPQCDKAPVTCRLINDFQPAAGCRRGQAKFSLMESGTHVWPHCGPTNCRLRAHLGLIVPANVSIRVASETRSWEEGRVMVFDDSFEHEVWHNGTSSRLILIVDVWHPELTARERETLAAI